MSQRKIKTDHNYRKLYILLMKKTYSRSNQLLFHPKPFVIVYITLVKYHKDLKLFI